MRHDAVELLRLQAAHLRAAGRAKQRGFDVDGVEHAHAPMVGGRAEENKDARAGLTLQIRDCRDCARPKKPVILRNEEPLTFAGGGGEQNERARSSAPPPPTEKSEVLRLRSLPPAPPGNCAQNDSLVSCTASRRWLAHNARDSAMMTLSRLPRVLELRET